MTAVDISDATYPGKLAPKPATRLEDRPPRFCRPCKAEGVDRTFGGRAPASTAVDHYIKKHATEEELPTMKRLLDKLVAADL